MLLNDEIEELTDRENDDDEMQIEEKENEKKR